MNRYSTGKYIKSEEALYGVLHKKHPNIDRASFEITSSKDLWTYRAPEKLTATEIEPAEIKK
ncbi:hypothetical protein CUC08_Gglean002242 [Alternaria sp. MG1]|nr:hypothetical protein CUC08_Gglean002242 [Alternaria sp. MG1]